MKYWEVIVNAETQMQFSVNSKKKKKMDYQVRHLFICQTQNTTNIFFTECWFITIFCRWNHDINYRLFSYQLLLLVVNETSSADKRCFNFLLCAFKSHQKREQLDVESTSWFLYNGKKCVSGSCLSEWTTSWAAKVISTSRKIEKRNYLVTTATVIVLISQIKNRIKQCIIKQNVNVTQW